MTKKKRPAREPAPTRKELPAYERKLVREIAAEVERIRGVLTREKGVKRLLKLRERDEEQKSPYENINQYPHKWLCIKSLKLLYADNELLNVKDKTGLKWFWAPTTGEGLDIEGVRKDGQIIVAAECSTVTIPYESLIRRIRTAIDKINESRAKHKYLFVLTEETEERVNNVRRISGIIVKRIN